ncbi:2-nitropropane dioxygenase [Mucidula mucida]|nr:2-nitropropane dioxygenase [Mucidula mucida]
MASLSTRLTRLLNLKTPIALPPMANVSQPGLISKVTSCGAFGFVGAGPLTPDQLTDTLRTIRSNLNLSAEAPLPVGVGFITWILEKNTPEGPDPRVTAVLNEHVKAIWLAFGNDNGRYVKQIRDQAPETLIFVLVNSVEEALHAANELHADVLVVQGNEAGGHGSATAPPLNQLLTAVVKALPDDGPVIVAAGGIATGAQIASILTLGADGAALGTRFLMTHESGYPQAKKDALVKAGLLSTARSTAFDEVNKTVGWPEWTDGRGIANAIIDDVKKGLDLPTRLANAEGSKGDMSRTTIWAGAGVGLNSEIQFTEDVVRELNKDAVAAVRKASLFIAP